MELEGAFLFFFFDYIGGLVLSSGKREKKRI
jgi:hypothetical protein